MPGGGLPPLMWGCLGRTRILMVAHNTAGSKVGVCWQVSLTLGIFSIFLTVLFLRTGDPIISPDPVWRSIEFFATLSISSGVQRAIWPKLNKPILFRVRAKAGPIP